MEKSWVLTLMFIYFDLYHLPKHFCRPNTPCHGNGTPRWQQSPPVGQCVPSHQRNCSRPVQHDKEFKCWPGLLTFQMRIQLCTNGKGWNKPDPQALPCNRQDPKDWLPMSRKQTEITCPHPNGSELVEREDLHNIRQVFLMLWPTGAIFFAFKSKCVPANIRSYTKHQILLKILFNPPMYLSFSSCSPPTTTLPLVLLSSPIRRVQCLGVTMRDISGLFWMSLP